jgi:hypothetical protein
MSKFLPNTLKNQWLCIDNHYDYDYICTNNKKIIIQFNHIFNDNMHTIDWYTFDAKNVYIHTKKKLGYVELSNGLRIPIVCTNSNFDFPQLNDNSYVMVVEYEVVENLYLSITIYNLSGFDDLCGAFIEII